MNVLINSKEYKFYLFHTHVAEDLIHNMKLIEFEREKLFYMTKRLEFFKDSYREIEELENLKPLSLYYLSDEKKILFNYSYENIKLDNKIKGSILGSYIDGTVELAKYFEQQDNLIKFDI